MPIEYAPPKYVMLANELSARIESGVYPAGAELPSEAALEAEFKVSRPTVTRAYRELQRDGWVRSLQGKGRYSLGKPVAPGRSASAQVRAVLAGEVRSGVRVSSAGEVPAPQIAASALGVEPGSPVVARQWLVVVDEVGPVELNTAYLPTALAAGTNVGQPAPLRQGLLEHLRAKTGADLNRVRQRIWARKATAEETRQLQLKNDRGEPVLSVLYTVCDAHGRPVFVVHGVLPGSRHELEDVFTLH